MDLTTLMYVSTSRLEPATADTMVQTLVASARVYNAAAGITGALLFTGRHFVQIVEGDAGAIEVLVEKLQVDNRHERLTIVNRGPLKQRRFGTWELAFSGASHFVKTRVNALLIEADPQGQRRAMRWLTEAMYQFTRKSEQP